MAHVLPSTFIHSFLSGGGFNSGGYLKFYEDGTSTPQVVYEDNSLSTSLGSKVTLNSVGQPQNSSGDFVAIYMKDAGYKIELYDTDDNLLNTVDPYNDSIDQSTTATTTRSASLAYGHNTLVDSQVLGPIVFDQALTLPAGATNSQAEALTAANAEAVFDLQKNSASVGSVTFAAAGTTGAYSVASEVSFAVGDTLHVVGPSTADTTLRHIGFTFQFTV